MAVGGPEVSKWQTRYENARYGESFRLFRAKLSSAIDPYTDEGNSSISDNRDIHNRIYTEQTVGSGGKALFYGLSLSVQDTSFGSIREGSVNASFCLAHIGNRQVALRDRIVSTQRPIEETFTLKRGTDVSGAATGLLYDSLLWPFVYRIVSVYDSARTYVATTDYVLTINPSLSTPGSVFLPDRLTWQGGGTKPTVGNTYSVILEHYPVWEVENDAIRVPWPDQNGDLMPQDVRGKLILPSMQ